MHHVRSLCLQHAINLVECVWGHFLLRPVRVWTILLSDNFHELFTAVPSRIFLFLCENPHDSLMRRLWALQLVQI